LGLARLRVPPLQLPCAVLLLAMLPAAVSAQTVQWIRQFGSFDADLGNAVAANSTGIYVAGYTLATIPGGNPAGNTDAFLRKYDASGNIVWTQQFGTPGFDQATAVAVDSTGVYVAGLTADDFPGQNHAGATDVFLRKYSFDGTEVWTKQFGTSANEQAYAVAAGSGFVVVAGQAALALPGQTAFGGADAFVREYDTDGTERWTRQFGTSGGDVAYGVAIDASGVYTGGDTSGTFPGQSQVGNLDAFVQKHDHSGTPLWIRQFGSTGEDRLRAVGVSTGVYAGGHTFGTFPGQTKSAVLDAFVAHFDLNGVPAWARQFGSIGASGVLGIAATPAGAAVGGNVFGPLSNQTSAGGADAYLRFYDPSGAESWTRQFGSPQYDQASGVAWDGFSSYYAAGYATEAMPGQTFSGVSDAFVARIGTAPATSLSVSPTQISITGEAGGSTKRRVIQVTASGASLSWEAAEVEFDGLNWLTLSPPSGTTAANQPSLVNADVNFAALSPGVYQAVITVRDTTSNVTTSVQVQVIAKASAHARISTSPSTLVFSARAGGPAPPTEMLRIFNSGDIALNWNIAADVPGAAPWLNIAPSSGTAAAGTTSLATLTANPSGLVAGVYQALLRVSSPNAGIDSSLALVTLLVAPANDPPKGDASGYGIIFVAQQGGPVPASQTVALSNAGGGSLTFTAQSTSSGSWLSASPPSGNVTSGPAQLTVSASAAALNPGIYRGKVTVTFSAGVAQELEVLLIVTPAPSIAIQGELPGAAVCAPATMDFVLTTVGNGLSLPISFPRAVLAQIAGSCGEAVNDATVIANIEGRSIVLQGVGAGLYSGDWTPEKESAAVQVTVSAAHHEYTTVQRTFTVSSAAAPGGVTLPILSPDGVVEGAGFTPQRPLAPGGIISLFGQRFAAADSFAASVPLPTSLGGVSVRMAGADAPLYYAGTGQINAQMPVTALPGDRIEIAVNANGRWTAPQAYLVAPAQPGIFKSGDFAAVLDSEYRPVNAQNPARSGDTLQIFATGLGGTAPPASTGDYSPDFSTVHAPVSTSIGGISVPVVYQGLAPGYVGLYQVNVVLTGVPSGTHPVVLRQNGITSNINLPVAIPIQ
jgi:uncharacterized protein (TIGR03437 family)